MGFDTGLFVRLVAIVLAFCLWMVAGYMIQALHSPLGWVVAAVAVTGIVVTLSFRI